MKKSIILFVIIIIPLFYHYEIAAQKITRGPDIGEIYFLGPTNTYMGLYYSSDFGETAVCTDDIMNIHAIAADLTKGGIYCVESPSNLYFSTEYGNNGSWIVKNSGISLYIKSERINGEIYSDWYYHSIDYGSNFNYLNGNGYFGNMKDWDIGAENNYGYIVVYKQGIVDSVYFLRTNNNFEDIYQANVFNYLWNDKITISRGYFGGEVFLLNIDETEIIYSSNFGTIFKQICKFNVGEFFEAEILGGRQEGELYILCNFVNMMWQNAHTYIFHSTDYGKTFEVFHPFSKGNQPVLANFSSVQTEGIVPFTIEWCNFSIGEDVTYEWDFDNNGTIDSNEENPVYTYEEAGVYSVKLSVVGSDSTNSFTKEDYITVSPFPAQPQDLTAEIIDDDVSLNWQPILLDTTLLGYNVYRDTTLLTPEPITSTSYEDLNLPNGTYEYCVTAVYTYAVSEKSCVEASITVGIEQWKEAGLMIYPNPVHENICITFPGRFNVSVFGSGGEQLLQKTAYNLSAQFQVQDWQGGIYFFVIDSGEKQFLKKVVVK
ncbi:MAG: hypothetical protein B6I19_02620 [Bacteroidetes bacterium 4572_114]|nr:MAG: hypothetical protein B6I19_02620 [Bacteroidetes bacterium 4572_114]